MSRKKKGTKEGHSRQSSGGRESQQSHLQQPAQNGKRRSSSTNGGLHTEDSVKSNTLLRQPSKPLSQSAIIPPATEHVKGQRLRSFAIRTMSTIVLISFFVIFIYWGHVPLMFMVLGIQFTIVRELFGLANVVKPDISRRPVGKRKTRALPSFTTLQWYWFAVMAFFMYFRFMKNNLIVEITSNAKLAHLFGWAVRHYALVSFTLYIAGFIAFVLTLEKDYYSYQFKQFAWTHTILTFIFIPSSFFVSNIFEGLIWFLLPTSLVIINDIFAYLAGFFFGRTPLIKLSPKKTWEGFLGGFLVTLVAAYYLAALMSRFSWMTCPRTDLTVWGPLKCPPNPVFQRQRYVLGDVVHHLPSPLESMVHSVATLLPDDVRLGIIDTTFTAMPMQIHAVMLGMMASFAAPFGGFFASGFKRAFKIKDFGDSIPGHGGMTDRMDCQIVMAVLSYMYYNHFVDHEVVSVAAALNWVMKMPDRQQLELFERFSIMLAGEDLIPDSLSLKVQDAVSTSLRTLVVH